MGKAALTVNKNNYLKNPKDSNIQTPPLLAKYIYDVLFPVFDKNKHITILDPCIGIGNLVAPWLLNNDNISYYGFDVNKYNTDNDPCVINANFLELTRDTILKYEYKKPDIALLNPPWNHGGLNNEFKKWLRDKGMGKCHLPTEFLLKVFELFGEDQPVACLFPFGFLANQWRNSKRYRLFEKLDCNLKWRVSLPIDIYPNTSYIEKVGPITKINQPNKEQHNELLFYNIDPLTKDQFLSSSYIDLSRPKNMVKEKPKQMVDRLLEEDVCYLITDRNDMAFLNNCVGIGNDFPPEDEKYLRKLFYRIMKNKIKLFHNDEE